jgi:acyl-CoA synthetase (AMP-forming)/AMP-acid ligase II
VSWIERLARFGRAPALIFERRRVSFLKLARAARARLRDFERIGMAPGQAVVISLPNSAELVIDLLALLDLNAIPVLVPEGLGIPALRAARQATAAAWIRDARGVRRGAPPRGRLDESITLVKVSSGSTGEPKAVALTPRNLRFDGRQVRRGLRARPADRVLISLPLLHSYGFDFGFLQLLFGTALILAAPLPRAITAALAAGATIFPAIPFVLDLLSRHAKALRPVALRVVVSAAAPLAPELAERAARALGRPIRPHYGSTEGGALTLGRRQRWPGDVGFPLPGVGLRLRGKRVEAWGAQVALGYLSKGHLARQFGGRFLSQDRGRIGPDGSLTLLGRADRVRVLPSGTKEAVLTRGNTQPAGR